jgi:hypothetical protein
MAMPWTLARDFAEAIVRLERERLLAAAVAARVAQADGRDWEKWVKEVSHAT